MIVLDTTVLSFATGGVHPLRRPCRRLLEAHGRQQVDLTTTVEVLQEYLHVRARRRSRSEAIELARGYRVAFDLITMVPSDLDRGFELFERHPRLGAFDAVLAAVALERHAEALVSADHAFGLVEGLRWIDPASPALDELIG